MTSLFRVSFALIILFVLVILTVNGCGIDDGAVASVNGEIITRSELDRFIRTMQFLNPDLDDILQGSLDTDERRKIEIEFVQLLTGMVLIRQEMERLSLNPVPNLIEEKTEKILLNLQQTHYRDSREEVNRRLNDLALTGEDLYMVPRHETLLQMYFHHIASAITEEELRAFAVENPELLKQREQADTYRIAFYEEHEALKSLKMLRSGLSIGELGNFILENSFEAEFIAMGWLVKDDPFIPEKVKELFFDQNGDMLGGIVQQDKKFHLYWPGDYKAASVLSLEEARDEIKAQKEFTRYQEYYKSLWNKGEVELFIDCP